MMHTSMNNDTGYGSVYESYNWERASPGYASLPVAYGASQSMTDFTSQLLSSGGSSVVDAILSDPRVIALQEQLKVQCKVRAQAGATDALNQAAPWLAVGIGASIVINAFTVWAVVDGLERRYSRRK